MIGRGGFAVAGGSADRFACSAMRTPSVQRNMALFNIMINRFRPFIVPTVACIAAGRAIARTREPADKCAQIGLAGAVGPFQQGFA